MKDPRQGKYPLLSIRSVANGWEVRQGSLSECTYQSWVFESWESLTKWLFENLENNT